MQDDGGALCYRPTPDNSRANIFPLSSYLLETTAYKAKVRLRNLLSYKSENGQDHCPTTLVDKTFSYNNHNPNSTSIVSLDGDNRHSDPVKIIKRNLW